MTKAQVMSLLSEFEDDEEVDMDELNRIEYERRQALIEEIEERQHASGFYAFQDLMEMRRRER